MTYYIALPLLVLLAAAEASVLPLFRVSGVQPNVVLVLLVAWLMVRGANEAFVLNPAGGLLLGLVDAAPLGTALLALAPLAVLHELRGARLRESGLALTLLFTLVATVVYHLTYLLLFTVQGESGSWPAALLRVVLPSAVLNGFVVLPLYVFIWLSSGDLRRAAFA